MSSPFGSIFDVDCKICGSQVLDIKKHQEFHNLLILLAETVQELVERLEKKLPATSGSTSN